jgi:hypothetical protein
MSQAAETWAKLRSRYPEYFKPELTGIPESYADDVSALFQEVTRISGGRQLIEIDIIWNGIEISASMRPVDVDDEITYEQKASLFVLMKTFGRGDHNAAD